MGPLVSAMRWGAPALLAALILAGCGGDDETTASSMVPSAAAIVDPAQGAVRSAPNKALPDLEVVDVASGRTVSLQEQVSAGKPVLLWFWAPHCTFCRAEAPDLTAFQQKYAGQVQVLGLGAQDDLDQAVDFLADTGIQDLPMVWDKTGKSWLHFQVTNQPTVVVVDAEGKVAKRWFRDFDADAILKAAGLAG